MAAASATTTPSRATKPLDWRDRSDRLKEHIDTVYDALETKVDAKQEWYFSGTECYGLCSINEFALIYYIIHEAPAFQKEFWIMDIGAGNFQWSKRVVEFLNNEVKIPEGITVHIISLRGEKNLSDRVTELGPWRQYDLGAIKIEEISSALLREGFDLTNKVDLIVSRWTFRHLTDPTGTFAQAYDLLTPGRGLLLLDGFFAKIRRDTSYDLKTLEGHVSYEENMMRIVMDTQAQFLSQNMQLVGGSLNQFAMRRIDGAPCRLPLSYSGTSTDDVSRAQIYSGKIQIFSRTQEDDEAFPVILPGRDNLVGHKSLYEWLKQRDLFMDSHFIRRIGFGWKPFREEDKPLETPPLHQAIQAHDYDNVEKLLSEKADVNESNKEGNTPLHLALGDERMLSIVLDYKPLVELVNKDEKTVLDLAIESDNTTAIEMLTKAGARAVNWKNEEALTKYIAE